MSTVQGNTRAPLGWGGFADYQPPAGVFDEMTDAAGAVREAWRPLVAALQTPAQESLEERREAALELLRAHGVTYNVSSEGQSAERTWELDMLPLVISAPEWAQLEAGLIQRTRLLNLVLEDFYGPQRLFHQGLLPPALLHANPGFLRPCHGLLPPRGRFLTLHAVDLTRAPDGQWWVFADRTQAPSGVGYAVENRAVLSRVLAEEFRACQVRRLAPFFTARKEGLRALAPWTREPSIVLLTPGPLSETYFEHAYIARHLGYPLVEGSDLAVRNRRVFLKTLEGLQPVDVIVRRVDDTFCDPLELRSDSLLGVPGLLEAARAGTVAISNALGAGAVEAPALLAFLPALARQLLGEDLRLPNAATWWCGQKREREHALSHLSSLVIKRSFVGGPVDPLFGEMLRPNELAALAVRIQEDPHDYLAQQRIALSTAPAWVGGRLEPRPLILRCFVCATEEGFTVLSGGLTRFAAAPGSPIVSSKQGGGSKDTWVLSDQPWIESGLAETASRPPMPEHKGAPTPSRAAENLYWLGRYAERLEDGTRLLRTLLGRLAGEGTSAEEAELNAFTACLAVRGSLAARFQRRAAREELISALRQAIFDPAHVGSMRELLRRVGDRTASVRDRLSGDTWRILNHLRSEFPATPANSAPAAMLTALHRLIGQLAALSGMEMENMTRGDAWRFLEIGRRIERGSNLLAVLRAVLAVQPAGGPCLPPLLEYTDSSMSYRRRFFAQPELPEALSLLLAEEANPRSFAFQMKALGHHLQRLPGGADSAQMQRFAGLAADLESADWPALGQQAAEHAPQPLEELLSALGAGLWDVSDLLAAHYFSHISMVSSS